MRNITANTLNLLANSAVWLKFLKFHILPDIIVINDKK
jgi:hypothetical protein